MSKWGGQYNEWYVGIATDPRQRLFNDHNVDEKNDGWIYRVADSSTIAREAEDYFLKQKKTDGGGGGGDNNTKTVYAYKKRPHTKQ